MYLLSTEVQSVNIQFKVRSGAVRDSKLNLEFFEFKFKLGIGTFIFAAVRFGRVPKKEKAKIMEQMQKVNTQSQVSSSSSLLVVLVEPKSREISLVGI